jgi:gluconolactonase
MDPGGKITTIREDSGGANGLALTKSGELYAVEGAEFAQRGVPGKRISRANQTGNPVTVANTFQGKPSGAPNDLVLDAKGGIYFTDPGPHPFEDPNHHGDVYYLRRGAKEPVRIDDQIKLPNGITLTMDWKTLLVADSFVRGTSVRLDIVAPDLIKVPRRPANCAFSGPDKKTLYVTAREGLYRIVMISQGPRRPGK